MEYDFNYYIDKLFGEKFDEYAEKACKGVLIASGLVVLVSAMFIW